MVVSQSTPVEADLPPLNFNTLKLTAEQFQELCAANPDRPLELTSAGILVIMAPVGSESGN
jgi:Uma2 family endonuclease